MFRMSTKSWPNFIAGIQISNMRGISAFSALLLLSMSVSAQTAAERQYLYIVTIQIPPDTVYNTRCIDWSRIYRAGK